MLKRVAKVAFLIVGLIVGAEISMAQVVDLPYFCGFEDQSENDQWKLVQAKVGKNKWYLGSTIDASLGIKSMVVSCDGGVSMTYTEEQFGAIAASRVFALEPGTYELSFDYKVGGERNGKSVTDGLYLCLQPDTGKFQVPYNNLSTPDWLRTGKVETFSHTYTWMNYKHTFTVSSKMNYRVSFVWRNDDVAVMNPSVAIDNVQLGSAVCAAPNNITTELETASQINIQWEGEADKYEVAYKPFNRKEIQLVDETSKNTYTMYNIENGVYDFWVRSICGSDTSIWSQCKHVMVYKPEGCINYIDFHDESVTAYTGSFQNPRVQTGVVDKGFAADSSRHTVHYIPDEYDPRTGGLLKTVPEGKFASVRLGNWLTGSQAEALEYVYTVPEDAGILLLQYAVVLENPQHDVSAQPRFTLRMTDAYGRSIENACGDADFIPGKNTDNWHKTGAVEWKDWTYVGINLQNYIGEEIHIMLTTYDCNQTGHYGYAYFTIDCIDAAFTGLSCGEYTTDTVWGPMGFRYEWYKWSDYVKNKFDKPVSTERYICPAPTDTSSYVLRNFFVGDGLDNCQFDMKMSLAPRWPVARASYVVNKYDCKNVVTFKNNSYVRNEKGKTDQKIKDFLWDFGNGKVSTVKNPTMIYEKGGSYTVKLYAYLADGLCEDSVVFTLDLDDLHPVSHEYSDYFCEGSFYAFHGMPIFEAGDIVETLKTDCGCDSVVTLHLSTRPKYTVSVKDTICEGVSYPFGSDELTSSGLYKKRFKTTCGCDSVVSLNLEVTENVELQMGQSLTICADQKGGELDAVLTKGQYDRYEVRFDAAAKSAGFVDQTYEGVQFQPIQIELPQNVVPNVYNAEVVFEKRLCDPQVFPFTFKVLYPSSIMAQKWDDVVAVKNAQYNGGYDFVSFKWYKNGVLLEGQRSSYIYTPNETNEGAEYVVEVQRNDGVVLESCPMVVQAVPQSLRAYPSRVARGEKVTVEGGANTTYQVWNLMGGMESQGEIKSAQAELEVSDRPGVYLLHIQTDTDKKVFRIMIE